MSVESDMELGRDKTAFIVSPIGDSLAPLGSPGRSNYEDSIFMWSKVFEPACETFGLRIVRSDRIADPGEIPDQIFSYLSSAEVVVADLSGANPNVMYELGLRHSRSAITLQVGEYGRLPFDVSSIRTIQFNRDEAGLIAVRDQLIESLRAALESGPTDLRATRMFANSDLQDSTIEEDVRKSAAPDTDVLPEEPGIIDMLAEAETAVTHVSEVLVNAQTQIVEIGERSKAAGEDVADPSVQAKGFAGRLQITRKLASDLDGPATELESSANEFYADVQSIDAMVRHVIARVESGEENTDEIGTFLSGIKELVDAAEQGAVGIVSMRDGSKSLRKMSASLAPVSRTIERALNRFLEAIRQMQEWKGLIDDIDIADA